MDFIADICNKAKKLNKTIVLPEADDPRILKATEIILKSKLANIILVGDEEKIKQLAKDNSGDISGATIINPLSFAELDRYTQKLKQKRERKGMTLEEAKKLLTENKVFFGAMLVDQGIADGMVAGATCATANTIRATAYCVGMAPESSIISSFFAMVTPQTEFGEEGIIFYADCAVNPNPTAKQLAEIAKDTAKNFLQMTGKDPRVAMLSFSTYGSGKHADADKVVQATKIAKEKNPDLALDGELQVDAALIPQIGQKKAPGSIVAGKANVLIFPDLDAGNIAYKLTQRLGKAAAIGPVFQGAAKPINDISRGCSIDDIVSVAAIAAVQAT